MYREVKHCVASKTAATFSVYAFFMIISTVEKRVEKSVGVGGGGGGEGRKNGRSRRCRSAAGAVAVGRRRSRRLLVAGHALPSPFPAGSLNAVILPSRESRFFAAVASYHTLLLSRLLFTVFFPPPPPTNALKYNIIQGDTGGDRSEKHHRHR